MDDDEGSRSKAVYERTGTIDRQRRIKKRGGRDGKRGRKDDELIKGRNKGGSHAGVTWKKVKRGEKKLRGLMQKTER